MHRWRNYRRGPGSLHGLVHHPSSQMGTLPRAYPIHWHHVVEVHGEPGNIWQLLTAEQDVLSEAHASLVYPIGDWGIYPGVPIHGPGNHAHIDRPVLFSDSDCCISDVLHS